ncbi:MAG: hypothetical protein AAGA23_15820 [Pseudomonadota bacterium]
MPRLSLRISLLLGLAVLLAGCNSKIKRFDELTGVQPSQRVGVLPINFLPKVSAQVYNNALRFAGTAGRVAVAKADDSTRRKMTEGLEAAQYFYRQEINRELIARLNDDGIKAEFIEFRRSIDNVLGEVPPRRFEKRYPKDAGYDYLLDIYVEYFGYAAGSVGADYLPTAHVAVRVVDGASLDPIYESLIQYNPVSDVEGSVNLEANADFAYSNVGDLLDDVPRAKEGLKEAVDIVMETLISELKS